MELARIGWIGWIGWMVSGVALGGCARRLDRSEVAAPTSRTSAVNKDTEGKSASRSMATQQRAATVRIEARPSEGVRRRFLQGLEAAHLPPALMAASTEWLSQGSGFVVESAGRRFVVTNQHVVDSSSQVDVLLEDQTVLRGCEVVHADRRVDLALVALPEGNAAVRATPVAYLTTRQVDDNDEVQAAGFPSIGGGEVSYRLTSGTVSNARFELFDGRRRQGFVQHTAAIDPGNSGGPLFRKNTLDVIGINTLLMPDKHALFAAVPASEVRRALGSLATSSHDELSLRRGLEASCSELIQELSVQGSASPETVQLLSDEIVATHGPSIWARLATQEGKPNQEMISSLVQTASRGDLLSYLRPYVFQLMFASFDALGKPVSDRCESLHAGDLRRFAEQGQVRVRVDYKSGQVRTLTWALRQGQWRLTEYQ